VIAGGMSVVIFILTSGEGANAKVVVGQPYGIRLPIKCSQRATLTSPVRYQAT
jgi:hypothetical protein